MKKRVRITIIREYTDGAVTKRETTVQRWTEDPDEQKRPPPGPFVIGLKPAE